MGIVVKSFDVDQGDFFLIKVSNAMGKYFNLMVDCGKRNKLEDLKDALNGQRLNGIVVTHVDDDHIVGVIDLMENYDSYDFLDDVFIIYNKYCHNEKILLLVPLCKSKGIFLYSFLII